MDLQHFFAGFVADHDDATVVVEELGQPVAHPIPFAQLEHGAFVVEEGVGFAPGRDGEGMAGGVQGSAVKVAPGAYELPVALHPGAVVLDLHQAAGVLADGVDVDVRACVVDDLLPVGDRVARVVILVVRVALQVVAVGPHAVEVADALVVAEEINASGIVLVLAGDPHGRGDIAGQLS